MQIVTQSDSVVNQQQRRVLKYIDCYYTLDDDEPIIHLIARDEDGSRHHIEVVDFTPYFCVPQSEKTMDEWEQLFKTDHRITDIDLDEHTSMDGQQLAKIEVNTPSDVRDLRDQFDEPLEADVRYPTRFLIDTGIKQCFSVPDESDRITPDDITPIDPDDPRHIDVEPRVLTFDIEVLQGDGSGPSVISDRGIELAMQPITAIAAHDSYTDESRVWILRHNSWDDETVEDVLQATDAETRVYEHEYTMLSNFCGWVADRQFDVVTGWNVSFDICYLVNRCLKEKDVTDIFRWSPTRDVRTMPGNGKWINSKLKGMIIFDMLQGYEKTEVTELDSYRLDDVAEAELGERKADVGDIDDSWQNTPETFTEYVLKDTLLVVQLDRSRGILVGDGE